MALYVSAPGRTFRLPSTLIVHVPNGATLPVQMALLLLRVMEPLFVTWRVPVGPDNRMGTVRGTESVNCAAAWEAHKAVEMATTDAVAIRPDRPNALYCKMPPAGIYGSPAGVFNPPTPEFRLLFETHPVP